VVFCKLIEGSCNLVRDSLVQILVILEWRSGKLVGRLFVVALESGNLVGRLWELVLMDEHCGVCTHTR
jgi:hypothetical protein